MEARWSVRTYLWLLALAVAVPCAGMLVYSIASEARQDQRDLEATTLSLARLVASQTRQVLSDAEKLLGSLSQRPLMRALDQNQRDPVFDQFLDLHPQYANLLLCDGNGQVLQSAARPPE